MRQITGLSIADFPLVSSWISDHCFLLLVRQVGGRERGVEPSCQCSQLAGRGAAVQRSNAQEEARPPQVHGPQPRLDGRPQQLGQGQQLRHDHRASPPRVRQDQHTHTLRGTSMLAACLPAEVC